MSRSASGGADLLRFRSFTHYVAIEDSDLDNLPLPTSHTIEISEFVPLHQIQASLYFKSAYYVAPEKSGQKPYSDAPAGRHCALIAYVVLASEHRDGLW